MPNRLAWKQFVQLKLFITKNYINCLVVDLGEKMGELFPYVETMLKVGHNDVLIIKMILIKVNYG